MSIGLPFFSSKIMYRPYSNWGIMSTMIIGLIDLNMILILPQENGGGNQPNGVENMINHFIRAYRSLSC